MGQELSQFKVEWIDGHRFPKCVPDLRFPNGVDLDVTEGRTPACVCKLPYPAKRCGHFYIECAKCGVNAVVTTAGRIDDPRSIKMPCEIKSPGMELHIAPHAKKRPNVRVSTVFLGIDHSFNPTGPPVLWETMCFSNRKNFHTDCIRCSGNWEQAEAMHARVVQQVKEQLAKKKT